MLQTLKQVSMVSPEVMSEEVLTSTRSSEKKDNDSEDLVHEL